MSDPRENPIVLLERLKAVGIQIELRSGRLRVSGPRAVVTPEVIEQIEVNRAPLTDALRALASGISRRPSLERFYGELPRRPRYPRAIL